MPGQCSGRSGEGLRHSLAVPTFLLGVLPVSDGE